MTGEKYVKEITKRIHCSAKKKKDIQMQLLGEIRERQDMGEEFFEIIRQMGRVCQVKCVSSFLHLFPQPSAV